MYSIHFSWKKDSIHTYMGLFATYFPMCFRQHYFGRFCRILHFSLYQILTFYKFSTIFLSLEKLEFRQNKLQYFDKLFILQPSIGYYIASKRKKASYSSYCGLSNFKVLEYAEYAESKFLFMDILTKKKVT